MPTFINNNANNSYPFLSAELWYVLSSISNFTGSFLMFTTLLSFPYSWVATVTYTTLFRYFFFNFNTKLISRAASILETQIMTILQRVIWCYGWHCTLLTCLAINAISICICFYVHVFWVCFREIREGVVSRVINLKELHGLLVKYGVLTMIVWLGSMKEDVNYLVFQVFVGVVLVLDSLVFFMEYSRLSVMRNEGPAGWCRRKGQVALEICRGLIHFVGGTISFNFVVAFNIGVFDIVCQ